MVTLILLFTGCSSATVLPVVVSEEEFVTRFIPVSEVPKIYIDRIVMVDGVEKLATTKGSDGVFPPEINPLEVNYGDELSTWTSGTPALAIKNGDPLSIGIFNRTSEEVTYNISYKADIYYDGEGNEIKLKDDSKNEYETIFAPIFWTEFSDKTVTVPPETVAYVAVRINIPKKTQDFTLPDRWAFQVYVYPAQSGNVQRAFLQNWLISMR